MDQGFPLVERCGRDVAGVGGKDEDYWFPTQVSSVLGNGNSINFWKGKWHGSAPLRNLFPRLYEKEVHKYRVVSDFIQSSRFHFNWNREWLTSSSHTELAEKAELEQLLFSLEVESSTIMEDEQIQQETVVPLPPPTPIAYPSTQSCGSPANSPLPIVLGQAALPVWPLSWVNFNDNAFFFR
ncbi:unnamed protein product [Trifolium pratense]|uniref:Uncharacterized protein n=1 Tax=Trifolium pratense TaxID=57577 RepID=A0ACB0IY50_TRIPR|nr:unnamed protein product [Trifolium pratense]